MDDSRDRRDIYNSPTSAGIFAQGGEHSTGEGNRGKEVDLKDICDVDHVEIGGGGTGGDAGIVEDKVETAEYVGDSAGGFFGGRKIGEI